MVALIANLQSDAGCKVHVVYSRRPETPARLADMFASNVHLHDIKMSGLSALSAVFKLRGLFRKLRPGIVHLHSSFAGFVGRASTIFGRGPAKVFYSPHCISFMRQDIGSVKRTVFIALELVAGLAPCTYLACSGSEQAAIKRYLFKRSVVVENAAQGVEHVCSGTAPDSAVRIVTCGGIRAQKNPEEYAELCRRLASLPAYGGVTFEWLGDGDGSLRTMLEMAGVTVSGWLTPGEAHKQMRASSIYLSTSLWEGMPISVIEAMGLHLPIVARNCDGNRDLVASGRTGEMYDDLEGGFRALCKVIDDVQLRSSYAENAAVEFKKRFTPSVLLARLEEVYSL